MCMIMFGYVYVLNAIQVIREFCVECQGSNEWMNDRNGSVADYWSRATR